MSSLRKIHRYDRWLDLAKSLARFVNDGFLLILTVTAVASVWLAVMIAIEMRQVPNLHYLRHYHPVNAVEIYDKNDKLVLTIEHDTNRRLIPLDQIPNDFKNAIIQAEDRHFYEHEGVNPSSIGRALLANLQARHIVEGGSTITQQLVKNLFFRDGKRSIERKVTEALVAFELERLYSKDDILYMYLNEIYFGNGASGIQQAAWNYFAKDVSALNLAESAFLAAVIKAPSIFGTVDHRSDAYSRARQILDRMLNSGMVTQQKYYQALATDLNFKSHQPLKAQRLFQKYPYYISYVLDLVRNRYGDNIVRHHGLKVYTNLDQTAQKQAEQNLSRGITYAPKGINQGALVSIGIKDGAVRALVGGVGDYWKNQWNSATNPHTVGSAFKPFVYLTAFEAGVVTPESIVDDTPVTIKQLGSPDYKPKNFDRKFLGPITVRQALYQSRNVCALRVAQQVGFDQIARTARKAGITAALDPNPSLALGTCAISPLQMASAYATFARGGITATPCVLRRVETLDGRLIDAFAPAFRRVYNEQAVAQLVDVMIDVVNKGTGTQGKLSDRPVAGKTGTADKSKDIWFVGFTPDMVTAVWGGNKDNSVTPDSYVTGGTVMARIWREYNKAFYAQCPTPAGNLIAYRDAATESDSYKHTDKKRIAATSYHVARATGSHRSSRWQYTQPSLSSPRNVSSPTGGMVIRTNRIITDYRWAH